MAPSNAVTVRVVQAADVPTVVARITNVLAEFGLCFGSGSDTDEQVLKLPYSYDAGGGRFWVISRCSRGYRLELPHTSS